MSVSKTRWILVSLAGLSTLGAGIVVAAGSVESSGKSWQDPWKGLSDSEKQATVSAAHAAGRTWFQDFTEAGRDPRSLPIFPIDGYAAPFESLDSLAAAADVIVIGRVEAQSFSLGDDTVLPHSTVKLRISQVMGGDAPAGSIVTLIQTGGPMRTAAAEGGSMAQLEGSPLVLMGDVVILAARQFEDGTLQALPGLGVHFTDGEQVTSTGTTIRSPLVGVSIEEAVSRITELARSNARP